MIKNFKLYKESLLDKLEGPSEKEVSNNLLDRYDNKEIDEDKLFRSYIENGMLEHIDDMIRWDKDDKNLIDYGFRIAMDSNNIDSIKYFLDLGVSESEIVNELNIDDGKHKELIQSYYNKIKQKEEPKKKSFFSKFDLFKKK